MVENFVDTGGWLFIIAPALAEVAKLVDAPDSKSGSSDTVRVQVSPSAPFTCDPNMNEYHSRPKI